MEFKQALEQLQKSDMFKSWKKENAHSYLVHGFILYESGNEEWQIGYYDKDKNKITTFRIEKGKSIEKNPEADILKEKNETINEVNLNNVKITLKEAIMVADGYQQEKYPAEKPLKKIALIQHLKVGQVWNITFLTKSYNTLNIKIDSSTGKVVEHTLQRLFGTAKE
jgi:hypothetical protein